MAAGNPQRNAMETDLPADAAEAARVPANLFGRYIRTARLGAGGMGEVWKAYDPDLRRWVALKFLRHDDPEELARFRREAQTAATLNHPNIAAVYEVGEQAGRPFIAMQYIEGATLAALPRSDVRVLVDIVRHAALAVHAAHQSGVVHRDIKPLNIMVEGSRGGSTRRTPSSGLRVYVMDFGLAKSPGGSSISISGTVIGTPAYMPPEQARGELREIDARSDVYALGATLYDLLTGRAPFSESNIIDMLLKVATEEPRPVRQTNAACDPDLETIVMKCLEKEKARRYATAIELAEDLERWLQGDPILARAPSTVYRIRKFVSRRRAVVSVAAVACAVLAVVGWRWLAAASGERRQREERLRELEARERARPYLTDGGRVLEQMRLRIREPYEPDELRAMARRAEEFFAQALAEDPGLPEAHLGTARAWAAAGETDRARQALDRAIAASSRFATAYLDRVRLVIDDYERLMHLNLRDDPKAVALRGSIQADLDQVARHARDALELAYAEALLAFADSKYERAAELLAGYLKDVPGDGRAHYWRGHALHHLPMRGPEALAELTLAIGCDARDDEAYSNRGLLLRARAEAHAHAGRPRESEADHRAAIEDYTRAVTIDPDFDAAWMNRALARERLGDRMGALEDCDRALRINASNAEIFTTRGYIRGAVSDHKGAVEDGTRAIEIDPR